MTTYCHTHTHYTSPHTCTSSHTFTRRTRMNHTHSLIQMQTYTHTHTLIQMHAYITFNSYQPSTINLRFWREEFRNWDQKARQCKRKGERGSRQRGTYITILIHSTHYTTSYYLYLDLWVWIYICHLMFSRNIMHNNQLTCIAWYISAVASSQLTLNVSAYYPLRFARRQQLDRSGYTTNCGINGSKVCMILETKTILCLVWSCVFE